MANGGSAAKWDAGNRILFNFNFVKKKIMEESEDIYQSDKQGSVHLIKALPLHVSYCLRMERPHDHLTPSIP